MRLLTVLFSITIPMGAFCNHSEVDQKAVSETSVEAFDYSQLDWKEPGIHRLSHSHSSISLPSGYALILEADAQKVDRLNNPFSNSDLEAIVYPHSSNDAIYFEYIDDGHVSLEDWEKVDPKALLEQMKEADRRNNPTRKEKGIEQLTVSDWIEKPTLNRETHTVHWVIKILEENGRPFFNAVALRLNRHGYERVVLATGTEAHILSGGHLDALLQAHHFDEGYRYEDFTTGDKLAEYGIAALVGASIGGQIVTVLGILAIVKKFGAFLIAGGIGLFYKMRKWFKKDKTSLSY